MIEISEHRIILQKVRERFRIGQIIYRDKVNVWITQGSAKDIASDATKAVDANLHRHCVNVLLPIIPERLSYRSGSRARHAWLAAFRKQDRNLLGKRTPRLCGVALTVKAALAGSFDCVTHILRAIHGCNGCDIRGIFLKLR